MIDLKDIPGPWLELGGPTDCYKHLDPIPFGEERLIVSNILHDHGPIDMIVDATNIGSAGFDRGSLGVIFWSCLPTFIRTATWIESWEYLRSGGLVIAQGATDDDLIDARRLGFKSILVVQPREVKRFYELLCVSKP